MNKPVCIKVPATSANLGPGFDAIGMALDLYNELWVYPFDEGVAFSVQGEGASEVNRADNLILQAYRYAFEKAGKPVHPCRMESFNRVPLSRGLGSSSAAIVSGLVAAVVVSPGLLSKDELVCCAVALDGHPDNVLPAFLGGIVVAGLEADGAVCHHKIVPPEALKAYVLIPDYPLSTNDARAALPPAYSKEDVVFNLSRMGLLVSAFTSGRLELLKTAMQDRLHERYRLALMPGLSAAREAALLQGALAAVVSGSGSTMLILSDQNIDTTTILETFQLDGHQGQLMALQPVSEGTLCFCEDKELNIWH